MKKISWSLVISIVSMIAFIILTLILSFGTKETYEGLVVVTNNSGTIFTDKIGLPGFNKAVQSIVKYNNVFDKLSDIFLYISIIIMVGFVALGVYQFIKGKSIKNVDKDLFILYGLYVVMLGFYLIFDKVFIVNNRPIVENINKGLEPSYPSSHVLLVVASLGAGSIKINKMTNDNKKYLFLTFAIASLIVETIFRTLSGAHWISDIMGSIILGISFISLYFYLANRFQGKPLKEEKKDEDDLIIV